MTRKANIPIFVPHAGCPHVCIFCDQRTITGQAQPPSPTQVEDCCRQALAGLDSRYTDVEIAFFGGSFTAIPREEMTALLEAVQPFMHSGGRVKGIRISTRPDAVSPPVLDILERYGVTAVELGVQSMDPQVLVANRRGHTPEDTIEASRLIQGRGLELGHQMMTGLYTDTDQGAMDTARQLIGLAPDTVRVYPTVVLEGTALATLWRRGDYQPPTLEQSVSLCARLLEEFEQAGVRVIRMGLHASPEVEVKRLAGVSHPAFRELCESHLMWQAMEQQIGQLPPGRYTLRVARGARSKAVGQHRCNLQALHEQGYNLSIQETDDLHGLAIELE